MSVVSSGHLKLLSYTSNLFLHCVVHASKDPGPRWKCGFGGLWVLADFGWTANL